MGDKILLRLLIGSLVTKWETVLKEPRFHAGNAEKALAKLAELLSADLLADWPDVADFDFVHRNSVVAAVGRVVGKNFDSDLVGRHYFDDLVQEN
jgi:hypothetical protein